VVISLIVLRAIVTGILVRTNPLARRRESGGVARGVEQGLAFVVIGRRFL
jgi:hypothetical protein